MNSNLQGNEYTIPEKILNKIKVKLYTNPRDAEGIKRAKNLIKNGTCSYEQLGRLKNFFDTFNSQSDPIEQFELAGGREMRSFVEQTLKSERDKDAREREIKEPLLAATNTNGLKAQTKNSILDMRTEGITEGSSDAENDTVTELNRNAVVVIFNEAMKVLMLKRSDYSDQWMPSKWSLPGGKIESGEEPLEAAKREVKEETGLELNKIYEAFVIQRSEENVEHIFVAKISDDEKRETITSQFYMPKQYDKVHLSKENSDYKWIDPTGTSTLDTVPNVADYIRIAADNKKYID